MPADLSAFVSGVLLLLVLVAVAALVGWLAARLFVHASRGRTEAPGAPARPREARAGSEPGVGR